MHFLFNGSPTNDEQKTDERDLAKAKEISGRHRSAHSQFLIIIGFETEMERR